MTSPANRIDLFDFKSVPMRTFHMTWSAFMLTFFGWFGIAPLMPIVRDELQLSKEQVANTVIASVAATILVRLVVGFLCDRIGPRRAYTYLLTLGSLPVMGIGLAQSYEAFLLFRLAIGGIGASFVITQYHTSVMFAPNVVGRAAATTAGWGNFGGGLAQVATPLFFAAATSAGLSEAQVWRAAMVVPGALMLLWGWLYRRFTEDTPAGSLTEVRHTPGKGRAARGAFWTACKDYRVWALFLTYGCCFGVELTFHNLSALYFKDAFDMSLQSAGFVAAIFGFMNVFARTLGGYASDRVGLKFGLRGRALLLGGLLLCEGLGLTLFSFAQTLPLAVLAMIGFALFTKMASGGTYAIVPFLNRPALGSVAGIIGAGGNVGAVCAGFLFRDEAVSMSRSFFWLGIIVAAGSSLTLLVRFSPETEARERALLDAALGHAG